MNFMDKLWEKKISHIRACQSFEDADNDIEFKNIPQYNYRYDQIGNNYQTLKESCSYHSIKIIFNNQFLEYITTQCGLKKWVDIEKEYYTLLKHKYQNYQKYGESDEIDRLNQDFNHIKNHLANYLRENISVNSNQIIDRIIKEIYADFKVRDFSLSFLNEYIKSKVDLISNLSDEDLIFEDKFVKDKAKEYFDDHPEYLNREGVFELMQSTDASDFFPDLIPEKILLLNFNYTNTPDLYIKQKQKSIETLQIHIHGDIYDPDNPMIFGYGDEIDELYTKIENLDDNRYLENIKSMKYLETGNYKNLLEFINNDPFQVFLFGHSCGLSDRTLLNTIFEHSNCISVKPFYYKREDETDNYSDLLKNISRHFNDKAVLRDKVVNKKYCVEL